MLNRVDFSTFVCDTYYGGKYRLNSDNLTHIRMSAKGAFKMTIIDIVRQLADCRFQISIDKARREPYRLMDRVSSHTIAKFTTEEDLETFRRNYCNDFVAKVLHELDPPSGVSLDADVSDVSNLQGSSLASVG